MLNLRPNCIYIFHGGALTTTLPDTTNRCVLNFRLRKGAKASNPRAQPWRRGLPIAAGQCENCSVTRYRDKLLGGVVNI
ncbi:MAG: hypothetical protein OHK0052_19470 [Anaerolineales bacterium]